MNDASSGRAGLLDGAGQCGDHVAAIATTTTDVKDRTPLEIGVFYNSATDDEKLVLEEAARSVGRIPTKRPDGSLTWTPLLAPETLNESIIARATAANPQGATQLRELAEIRAMHASVANIAAAEVKEALGS